MNSRCLVQLQASAALLVDHVRIVWAMFILAA